MRTQTQLEPSGINMTYFVFMVLNKNIFDSITGLYIVINSTFSCLSLQYIFDLVLENKSRVS